MGVPQGRLSRGSRGQRPLPRTGARTPASGSGVPAAPRAGCPARRPVRGWPGAVRAEGPAPAGTAAEWRRSARPAGPLVLSESAACEGRVQEAKGISKKTLTSRFQRLEPRPRSQSACTNRRSYSSDPPPHSLPPFSVRYTSPPIFPFLSSYFTFLS